MEAVSEFIAQQPFAVLGLAALTLTGIACTLGRRASDIPAANLAPKPKEAKVRLLERRKDRPEAHLPHGSLLARFLLPYFLPGQGCEGKGAQASGGGAPGGCPSGEGESQCTRAGGFCASGTTVVGEGERQTAQGLGSSSGGCAGTGTCGRV